jgi:hypothetical protein
MIWNVPKIWKGQDVWIIGGGPSLTSTFSIPDDIVTKVRNKELPLSAYSPYMESIHNKHVIGINVAYKLGNWVDMMFCGDTKFLLEQKMGLYEFTGLCVTCSPEGSKTPWIKFLERINGTRMAITQEKSRIVWNQTSGAAAINLAVHLGARRIILVAFDMNLTDNKQHWHNAYRKGSADITKAELPKKTKVLARHKEPFPAIKTALTKLGIEIYNISPNSLITCIEKKTLEELL